VSRKKRAAIETNHTHHEISKGLLQIFGGERVTGWDVTVGLELWAKENRDIMVLQLILFKGTTRPVLLDRANHQWRPGVPGRIGTAPRLRRWLVFDDSACCPARARFSLIKAFRQPRVCFCRSGAEPLDIPDDASWIECALLVERGSAGCWIMAHFSRDASKDPIADSPSAQ
jgi:hypothetical protein